MKRKNLIKCNCSFCSLLYIHGHRLSFRLPTHIFFLSVFICKRLKLYINTSFKLKYPVVSRLQSSRFVEMCELVGGSGYTAVKNYSYHKL